MPLYDLVCKCGFKGECFAKVAELDTKGRIVCPECGERAEQDWAAKQLSPGGSAIRFHGDRQESFTEGFHRTEVAEARQLFGEKAGQCIRDDGVVTFKDRSQQKAYMDRKAEVWHAHREPKA